MLNAIKCTKKDYIQLAWRQLHAVLEHLLVLLLLTFHFKFQNLSKMPQIAKKFIWKSSKNKSHFACNYNFWIFRLPKLDTRYLKINRKLYVVDETFLNDFQTLRRISATVIRLTKMSENLVRIHLTRQGGFMWKLTCSCGPVHFSYSVWLWRRWQSNKQWWQCKASKSQKSWEISWVSGHFSYSGKNKELWTIR